MGLRETALKLIVPLFVENPAQKQSFDQLTAKLEKSQGLISTRINAVKPQNLEKHRATLRHIIGIERWGTERLKVALGEAFKSDGQKDYHPDPNSDFTALLEDFKNTRLETLRVAKLVEQQNPNAKVEHNGFGELSIKGWLQYLNVHASSESLRLR
jgi:hypothetical protein